MRRGRCLDVAGAVAATEGGAYGVEQLRGVGAGWRRPVSKPITERTVAAQLPMRSALRQLISRRTTHGVESATHPRTTRTSRPRNRREDQPVSYVITWGRSNRRPVSTRSDLDVALNEAAKPAKPTVVGIYPPEHFATASPWDTALPPALEFGV